ncbi:hypothetical protein WDU94_001557 [Cyamophila willieti]
MSSYDCVPPQRNKHGQCCCPCGGNQGGNNRIDCVRKTLERTCQQQRGRSQSRGCNDGGYDSKSRAKEAKRAEKERKRREKETKKQCKREVKQINKEVKQKEKERRKRVKERIKMLKAELKDCCREREKERRWRERQGQRDEVEEDAKRKKAWRMEEALDIHRRAY